MGELGITSFVPVEKLLSNISSIFPQTHSKKYRVPLSYEFVEIQAAKSVKDSSLLASGSSFGSAWVVKCY